MRKKNGKQSVESRADVVEKAIVNHALAELDRVKSELSADDFGMTTSDFNKWFANAAARIDDCLSPTDFNLDGIIGVLSEFHIVDEHEQGTEAAFVAEAIIAQTSRIELKQ